MMFASDRCNRTIYERIGLHTVDADEARYTSDRDALTFDVGMRPVFGSTWDATAVVSDAAIGKLEATVLDFVIHELITIFEPQHVLQVRDFSSSGCGC